MANQEHIDILKQEADIWNIWRARNPDIYPDLKKANLSMVNLKGKDLSSSHLEEANLSSANLEGVNLIEAHLEDANLFGANLEEAYLARSYLERANFGLTNLKKAHLNSAHLEGAYFTKAHLEDADLTKAHLEKADFTQAHFEGADLTKAHLEGANFTRATFDNTTNLSGTTLSNQKYGSIQLTDAYWNETNLSVIDWTHIKVTGDEQKAKQSITQQGNKKTKEEHYEEYRAALRSYRQLATILRNQGLNEEANHFTYRAQSLQKVGFWYQIIRDDITLKTRIFYLGNWIFSWFMFLIAGYGYRFRHSLFTYILVICGFATAYYLLGIRDIGPHNIPGPHHLSLYEAFVVSVTAFHGRGFFAGTFSPADPQAGVAALEAFFGLLIEVTFIATLTQRLFSR